MQKLFLSCSLVTLDELQIKAILIPRAMDNLSVSFVILIQSVKSKFVFTVLFNTINLNLDFTLRISIAGLFTVTSSKVEASVKHNLHTSVSGV